MNRKLTTYFLIFTNIMTAAALIIFLSKSEMSYKLLYKMGLMSSITHDTDYKYTENPNYELRRDQFATFTPVDAKIVMLGDSITYGTQWNELLGRSDIVNRGIDSDITAGFLNRLADVYKLEPEKCLIMGGINDIRKAGIPTHTIYENYIKLVESLQQHGIEPVIQSTLYVSDEIYNWKEINQRVHELNTLLREYSAANDLSFIQVNKSLSINGYLNPIYTHDGVHLVGSGYAKWKQLILNELEGN